MSTPSKQTVTASEIADWVFCPEAYRLAQVGTRPTPAIRVARTEGAAHHATLAVAETAATQSIRQGRGLVVLGVIALFLAALWAVLR